jgi:hypothetical protein
LQSLSSASPKDEDEDEDALPLPSKPTSALPELRRAEQEKFWAQKKIWAEEERRERGEDVKVEGAGMRCMQGREAWRGSAVMRERRRDSSDFLVVGVVVLFLLVVCWVEIYG